MHVPVVIVVNSLTFKHCQGLDLGYTFVADFRHQLICGSLIFARFSAIGMGSAYTRDGLDSFFNYRIHTWFSDCLSGIVTVVLVATLSFRPL